MMSVVVEYAKNNFLDNSPIVRFSFSYNHCNVINCGGEISYSFNCVLAVYFVLSTICLREYSICFVISYIIDGTSFQLLTYTLYNNISNNLKLMKCVD